MKWYLAVSWDNTVKRPFVSDAGDLKGFEEWQLREGKSIVGWDDSAWIQCTSSDCDGEPDDVLQVHIDVPIYSPRLRKLLDEVSVGGIQYLPIRVLRRNGKNIPGFSVANIVNLVAALDLKSSAYDVYEDDYFLPERRGQIFSLRRAALKRERLTGLHVIRLKEYPACEFVSGVFRNAFERGRCTGYSFDEVELI